jgi:anti-sigma factor RsiW
MLPCPAGTVMSETRPQAAPRAAARLAGEPGRSDKVREGNAKLTSRCEAIRSQMFFYLDHELHDRELSDFVQHLESCIECRSLCDQERCIIESVRASRPMYVASPELRDRIADLLEQASEPYVAASPLRNRVQQILGFDQRTAALRFAFHGMRALAFVVAMLVFAGFWFFQLWPATPTPSEFAMMAVDSHSRRIRNQLPLEIKTSSPTEISDWFSGKVSFSLKLPTYQENSGQARLYHLEGARLVAFKNDYAAFVAYQMRNRPITLVVTSNHVAMPSGGEEIPSKGLIFRYDAINGLKVITWADRGLTYALVSDLEERGQQSCIVCHEGARDRDFIESLKPGRGSI